MIVYDVFRLFVFLSGAACNYMLQEKGSNIKVFLFSAR